MRISTFVSSGATNLTCRATFIKGDMYIRDMKNTAYVHLYHSEFGPSDWYDCAGDMLRN